MVFEPKLTMGVISKFCQNKDYDDQNYCTGVSFDKALLKYDSSEQSFYSGKCRKLN